MAGANGWTTAGLREIGDEGAWDLGGSDEDLDNPFEGLNRKLGFTGRSVVESVGEILVIDVAAGPFFLREKPQLASGRLVMLHAVVDGRPTYHSGRGEPTTLKSGHLVFRRGGDASFIHSERFCRIVTVIAPQHLLVPRYSTAGALSDCIVQADNSLPQRLLYSFIVGLSDTDGGGGLGGHTNVTDALGGLVSMALAQRPQPPALLSELAATRAADLLRYLRRNFANPNLTPSMMADELHISVRYAHKLMQLTGRSFREELVRLRLEAARLAFAARRRPRQTIADIAISVGFNDLSQFNRHFRAAFAITPRAARKLDEANGYDGAARGEEDEAWERLASRPASGGAPAMTAAAASRPL